MVSIKDLIDGLLQKFHILFQIDEISNNELEITYIIKFLIKYSGYIFSANSSSDSFNLKNIKENSIEFEIITSEDVKPKMPWKDIEKEFNENLNYFENIMKDIEDHSKRQFNFQEKNIKKTVKIKFREVKFEDIEFDATDGKKTRKIKIKDLKSTLDSNSNLDLKL